MGTLSLYNAHITVFTVLYSGNITEYAQLKTAIFRKIP